jgi:hypothetical protein
MVEPPPEPGAVHLVQGTVEDRDAAAAQVVEPRGDLVEQGQPAGARGSTRGEDLGKVRVRVAQPTQLRATGIREVRQHADQAPGLPMLHQSGIQLPPRDRRRRRRRRSTAVILAVFDPQKAGPTTGLLVQFARPFGGVDPRDHFGRTPRREPAQDAEHPGRRLPGPRRGSPRPGHAVRAPSTSRWIRSGLAPRSAGGCKKARIAVAFMPIILPSESRLVARPNPGNSPNRAWSGCHKSDKTLPHR